MVAERLRGMSKCVFFLTQFVLCCHTLRHALTAPVCRQNGILCSDIAILLIPNCRPLRRDLNHDDMKVDDKGHRLLKRWAILFVALAVISVIAQINYPYHAIKFILGLCLLLALAWLLTGDDTHRA
jgi:hypothetical protein